MRVAAPRGFIDEIVAPSETRERTPRLELPGDTSVVAARKAVQTRNATEEAILDAARAALAEKGFERADDGRDRPQAFVSRTAVYFYFAYKGAVVERLIQRAFHDIYEAASPYLDGDGDPRRELRAALARVVAVVNANGGLLLLAAQLSGRGEHMPEEWEPYIMRFVERAEARIARDQERGIAPDDIAPRLSAQALLAMVENHIMRDGDQARRRERVDPHLAELWCRAVYSGRPRRRPESSSAGACGAARRNQRHRGEARVDVAAVARGVRLLSRRLTKSGPGDESDASRGTDSSARGAVRVGGTSADSVTGAAPTAWTPPSTWRISPVIARESGESRKRQASATGVGSSRSQPSGAWRSQISARPSKPSMLEAATVCSGPAATRLQRTPRGPRSRAR